MHFRLRRSLGLLILVVLLSGSTFWYPSPVQPVRAVSPIQHIVFIVKENHTFDNYFGAFPGVNGATTGLVKVNGVDQTIALNPAVDRAANYCHFRNCAITAYDGGKMDAFNLGTY